MAFGDRPYKSADLNPQFAGHPGAPFTFQIGNVLRQAYFYSQYHGRVIIQQSYGYNIRNYSADLAINRAVKASTSSQYIGMTKGWRDMPPETTHIVATIFYIPFEFQEVEVVHRLKIIDASSNEDSNTYTRYITEDTRSRSAQVDSTGRLVTSRNFLLQNFSARYPYGGPFSLQQDSLATALSNVSTSTPGKCQIIVESKMNERAGGITYTTPIAFQPVFIQVTTEMRY